MDDNGVEIPAGLDTITLDVAGTVEGVITLDATLSVTSNIALEGSGFVIDGAGNQIFSVSAGSLVGEQPQPQRRLDGEQRRARSPSAMPRSP